MHLNEYPSKKLENLGNLLSINRLYAYKLECNGTIGHDEYVKTCAEIQEWQDIIHQAWEDALFEETKQ